MLYMHPIIQMIAIFVAAYVFSLGIARFRLLHLKQQATFLWKRHVALGITGLTGLLIGLVLGLAMVRISWYGFMVTGTHGRLGVAAIPFIVFGLLSGLAMNRVKKKRRVLPVLHGINNIILLGLALDQVGTGWRVLCRLVWGY